jgi:Sulfotransferase family
MTAFLPFFIVGFQRSGTTLLRLMLDNHPDIAVPLDTTGLWSRVEGKLDRYGDLASAAAREKLIAELLKEERIRLWEVPLTVEQIAKRWTSRRYGGLVAAFYESYAEAKGKKVWGDKDPGNMLRLSQLNRWFPEGRFIHIIRDGRDACLSQLNQDFGFDDVLPCAAAWREQVWWVREAGALLGPDRYFELRYEDLVSRPEALLREISDFLGVAYSPQMLEYHRKVDQSVPESKRHLWPLLHQPPRADNTEQWKNKLSSGQRICFEKRAGPLLRTLGYETLPGAASGGYFEELRSLARRARLGIAGRLKRKGQR